MLIDVENSNKKVHSVDKIGAEKVDKIRKKEPKKELYIYYLKKIHIHQVVFDE